MKYKNLVDPELKNSAVTIPYNKFMIYGDKVTHGLISRLTKTSPDVSRKILVNRGYNDLYIRTEIIEPVKNREKLPALVFIHGGAFSYRAAPYHIKLAAMYAAKAGCRAFIPDYHLLPDHPWPAAWHDCLVLYRYISENPDLLGIDAGKIGVTGDSAGSFFAEMLCNLYEQEALIKPCLQMLVYPLTDYDTGRDSMIKNSDAPVWNLKGHERMMAYYFPDMSREEIRKLMPMQQELPHTIPDTYIETAEYDILHDEGILYGKKLEAAGARVEINETSGTFHGYDAALDSKITRMNIEKRIAFLKRSFK